jgi:hypothetical protein
MSIPTSSVAVLSDGDHSIGFVSVPSLRKPEELPTPICLSLLEKPPKHVLLSHLESSRAFNASIRRGLKQKEETSKI